MAETDFGNNYFENKRFINKFIRFMNVYLIIDSLLAIIIGIIGFIVLTSHTADRQIVDFYSNYSLMVYLYSNYSLIVGLYFIYLVIKDIILIILIINGFVRLINFIIKIICHKTEEEEKMINPIILIFNIITTVIINYIIFLYCLSIS